MVKKKVTLDDMIVTQRDPALKVDHQSWLIWWLVENRPRGMTQWWYVIDESGKKSWIDQDSQTVHVHIFEWEDTPDPAEGRWDVIGRNYETLGGKAGYGGNYFVVSGSADWKWEEGRVNGQKEREELMARLRKGYEDETIGVEVDYQFFIENEGWYLAEQPKEDNQVRLFYRGSNDYRHGHVVEVTTDLMPVSLKNVREMGENDINTDTLRFLMDSDSWVLPSSTMSVLNWNRFPTLFLE